jgi:hypothetical protein
MIDRVDECLAYLQSHVRLLRDLALRDECSADHPYVYLRQRDYKDSELYILRYQQCLSRSMAMIKIHFVATVKALGVDIGKRLAEQVRGSIRSSRLCDNCSADLLSFFFRASRSRHCARCSTRSLSRSSHRSRHFCVSFSCGRRRHVQWRAAVKLWVARLAMLAYSSTSAPRLGCRSGWASSARSSGQRSPAWIRVEANWSISCVHRRSLLLQGGGQLTLSLGATRPGPAAATSSSSARTSSSSSDNFSPRAAKMHCCASHRHLQGTTDGR